MQGYLKTLPFIALMAMAAPLSAQDANGADGLSLGEPAEGGAQPYVKEEIDDWSLECVELPDGEEPCQMFQALMDEEDNQVANVRFFRLPEGNRAAAGAVISVPLETLLTAQLTIQVDDNPAKRYPFSVCDQMGCYARIGFTQEDIDTFKGGKTATVSLVPFVAPDQRVTLDMSLLGFTASYDKTSVLKPQ
jgi:invasion protein IalB